MYVVYVPDHRPAVTGKSVGGCLPPMQGFHMMDRDGDQMLSLQDLKQACTEAGLKLSKAELQVV